MRITIITSPFGYIPPDGYGAVERRWFNMGEEFVKQNHTVYFLSKKLKGEEQIKYSDHNSGQLIVIPVRGYQRRRSIYFDLFFDLIYSIKCLIKMPRTDILMMNTFWSPVLCKLFKYKYLVSSYNVARYPKGQFGLYRWADVFFCVSSAIEKALTEQIPTRKNEVKMINNPIDITAYYYREKERTSDMVIMYHGRIHPEKGLNILVSAVTFLRKKYSRIKLVLVGVRNIADGGGGDEYVKTLNRIAEGDIVWIDPISDPQLLAEKIATCDIYCYPSVAEKGETFGVAPLEAMGIGRPVIVSSLECFQDFVEDQVNGFVFNHRSPDAVKELSLIIENLIMNQDLCKEVGLRASETSCKFSNQYIANRYLSEFELLLDNYG